MTGPPLDLAARAVLQRYPALVFASASTLLGNGGGFSGARIWRVEAGSTAACLRAWPEDGPSPQRLRWIHDLMRAGRESDLDFVPAVFATSSGATWTQHAGRLWDLTTWMPGRADFREHPTTARIEAACAALALLHGVWARCETASGPCPAVRRRLAGVADWQDLVRSGWQPALAGPSDDPVIPWAVRAWRLLRTGVETVPQSLAVWTGRPVALQPCLCDVWHDHVLYNGAAVCGLIDYGSVKLDHVAVDLARLLGSMVGDDLQLRAAGLRAYRSLRPLSLEEEALAVALDRTGTLLGAANWIRWLFRDGRSFEDRARVADRLASLVQRLESWDVRGVSLGSS